MTMQEPYDTAGELTALATWIDRMVADETADRQSIAEGASARVKDIVLAMLGARERSAAAVTPPIETERQARQLPAVRAVYAAFDADPGPGKMTAPNLRMLLDAVGAAGVRIGAYDVRILEWLAGYEPQTCAVLAGLITRAAAAGQKMLPPGYEGVLGQAVRDAVKYCELTGGKRLIEQANFYRSVAPALGIAVDPR